MGEEMPVILEIFRTISRFVDHLSMLALAPLGYLELDVFSTFWGLNWRTQWLLFAWLLCTLWITTTMATSVLASRLKLRTSVIHGASLACLAHLALATGLTIQWGRDSMTAWHLAISNFDTYNSFGYLGPGYEVSRYAWAGSGYVLICSACSLLLFRWRRMARVERSLPVDLALWLSIVSGVAFVQRLVDTQLPGCWGAMGAGYVPDRLFWYFEDADSTLTFWRESFPFVVAIVLLSRIDWRRPFKQLASSDWGPPIPVSLGLVVLASGVLVFALTRTHAHDAQNPIPYDSLDQSYCAADTPQVTLPPLDTHLDAGTIFVRSDSGLKVHGHEGGSSGDLERDLHHQIEVAQGCYYEPSTIPLTLVANSSSPTTEFSALFKTRSGNRQPLQAYIHRPPERWDSAVLGSLPRSPKCARLPIERQGLLHAMELHKSWGSYLSNLNQVR